MLSGVSPGRSCSGHCREHDDGNIAERRHGFKDHGAGALDSPFIALFYEDRADDSGDRSLIREHAHDIGPPLDLAVEALDGVSGVKLGAMLLRKGHVGQHIGLGIVHQRGEPGRIWSATARHC